MKVNNRLNSLSEYHFQRLDEAKKKLTMQGLQLLDLSIGDPDLEVDSSIIGGLIKGMTIKDYNKYPPYSGIDELKKSIIRYYDEVYSVKLNIDEVLILIGSKEGINNIIPALCGIGDYALIPKLGYPVYKTCCHLWGVNTFEFELKEKNGYLPQLGDIPVKIIEKSKFIMLNYPNNPTGATANADFYKEVVKFSRDNDVVVINDGAYNEIIRPKESPLSILRLDGKRQCIEFGTFSKIYNMTGFRIGYAVGDKRLIQALLKIKSNVDSGQFIPIQYSAIEALKLNREYVNKIRNIYNERKILTEKLLGEHNISFYKGEGTFYVWCKVPFGYTTENFCEKLLKDYGIVVTPGTAFGESGEGCFRIALTKSREELLTGLEKLEYFK